MGLVKNYNDLASTPQRKIVLDLLEAGLSAVQPEKILENFSIPNIETYENIYLIGFGKGSARVSKIIEHKLGEKLTEGYVIDVTPEQFNLIQFTQGTHPLPSQTNIDFTKKVVERFQNKLSERDLVLVAVTGGGSALFELPIDGISLEQLIQKNNELLKSGKTIQQMNEERKKISKVKGGKLAQLLKPAKVLGLIFSDVPGNDLSVVASGPTVDGQTENILMLSNETALNAMKIKAEELGLKCLIFSTKIQGEAREVGGELIKNTQPNTVFLAGGETTVTVHGSGKGGRNQELVLGALLNIDEHTVIASFDSDGWDNTEFAGAIGDFQTTKNKGEIEKALRENNSFGFFQSFGGGIDTGRLPSNVADLMITYRF